MIKQFFFFSFLVFFSLSGFSQSKLRYRYELIGGIGPTGFLGDLGGSYANGTHLIKDYNVLATRYCLNAGVRYTTHSRFALKTMLSTAMVSGNDYLSQNAIRKNRNLNFRSPIVELSMQAEYYFVSDAPRNQFTKSRSRRKKIAIYAFAGIGTFYYDPKEQLADKHWYEVRQYHTEGQGLPGGPKQFSTLSMAVPFGLGFRKKINNRWSMGAEFGIRKTFTDYIDGVSGTYYDKAKLTQAYGVTAAALADPNLGKIDGATMAGQQRGNSKYKDCYMFLTINIGYKIGAKQHRNKVRF